MSLIQVDHRYCFVKSVVIASDIINKHPHKNQSILTFRNQVVITLFKR